MRVVSGTVGGRRLEVPPGRSTRPSSELVRGAIFNSLTSLGAVEGATVWDLFAGSGALGIEALSRGAATAIFVDSDRRAVSTIRANLDALGLADRARVVCADVARWVERDGSADLVLIDPPYAFDAWARLLEKLHAGLVVCESGGPIEPGERWQLVRVRRHGGTVVSLLQPRGVPTL